MGFRKWRYASKMLLNAQCVGGIQLGCVRLADYEIFTRTRARLLVSARSNYFFLLWLFANAD